MDKLCKLSFVLFVVLSSTTNLKADHHLISPSPDSEVTSPQTPTLGLKFAIGKVKSVTIDGEDILFNWSGSNVSGCNSNGIVITPVSIGSQVALDRSLKLVMAAALSNTHIVATVFGCHKSRQLAKRIRFCQNASCT